MRDTLSHSKAEASCGRGGTRGNGLNSRSEVVLYDDRLLYSLASYITPSTLVLIHTCSLYRSQFRSQSVNMLSLPFAQGRSKQKKRPVYPLSMTRPAATPRGDYPSCCASTRRSCSSISLQNRHWLSLSCSDENRTPHVASHG